MASNDTYEGALEVLLKQVAGMKMLADANLPFLIDLETRVLNEVRSPERQMQAAGIIPSGAANPQGAQALGMPPGMGGPGGPGVGMSAGPASFQGAGVPGLGPAGPPPANPDELRRVLSVG